MMDTINVLIPRDIRAQQQEFMDRCWTMTQDPKIHPLARGTYLEA